MANKTREIISVENNAERIETLFKCLSDLKTEYNLVKNFIFKEEYEKIQTVVNNILIYSEDNDIISPAVTYLGNEKGTFFRPLDKGGNIEFSSFKELSDKLFNRHEEEAKKEPSSVGVMTPLIY